MEKLNPKVEIKAETSFKPLTVSSKKSELSTPDQTARITAYASERARLLFGCYRKGEANDPDTYVAAITANLAHYPEDVIRKVTHPTEGLPIKSPFLPNPYEVHQACEAIMQPRREAEARRARVDRQLAERAEWEARHRSLAKNSDEAKAIAVLHDIAGAMDFFHKICRQRDGSVVYPKEMTAQLKAVSLASERAAWPILTKPQSWRWEAFLRNYLTVKVRQHLKEGDQAPWPWPPNKDGTFSTTGAPETLMSEDDMGDFK